MKKILGFLTVIALFIVCGASALAADNYPYEISDLYFTDLNLNRMANPANGCYANVKVRKTADNSDQAFVICALYDKNNTFINSSFMSCDNFAQGEEKKFGTTVNVPSGKTLGKVKAFVVSDMKNLTPLSSAKGVTANGEEVSNIFTVKGYIRENAHSNGLDSYKPNEALIFISETPLGGEDYNLIQGHLVKATFAFEDIPEIYIPGTFSIIAKEDGVYEVTSFTPDKDMAAECDCYLYAGDTIVWNGNYPTVQTDRATINFYTSGDLKEKTRYRLSTDNMSCVNTLLIVNGSQIEFDKDNYETYIVNNKNGKVFLCDTDFDGQYDVINTEYFAAARVDSTDVSGTDNKVRFSDVIGAPGSYITLGTEGEDIMYKIIFNGSEIGVSDLMPGDILSIKYDVTNRLQDSGFYDIYVSRDTVVGQYISCSVDSQTVTIGENEYKFIGSFDDGCSTLRLGEYYKIYFDYFGDIFYTELVEDNM